MANREPWIFRAIALPLLLAYNLGLLAGLVTARPWWLVDILLILAYVLGGLDAASESESEKVL